MKNFPSQNKRKNLSSFLSNHSKALMSIAVVGGQILTSYNSANGWHSSSTTDNYPTSSNPASFYPYPADASVPVGGSRTNTFVIVNSATCSHVSGVVNGHLSSTPSVDLSQTNVEYTKSHTQTHSSHGSHGSHCSGCCCCANR